MNNCRIKSLITFLLILVLCCLSACGGETANKPANDTDKDVSPAAEVNVGAQTYHVSNGGTEASYNGKEYASLYDAVVAASFQANKTRSICQIISLSSENIIISDTLPIGVLLKTNGYFDMEDEIMLSYTAKSNSKEGLAEVSIYPSRDGNSQTLYLPSVANYSKLNLHLPAGTEITSKNSTNKIVVSEGNSEIDYTQLFGDMSKAGMVYPIHITWEKDDLHIEQDVRLVKSANIHSAFVEVAEENVDDMVKWLNKTKANRTDGGNLLFLSSDGTPVYEGSLKNFHMRGNSSIGSSDLKCSYGFKLSQKASLIDNTVKAKAWCLVANGTNTRDNTSYGTVIGETLYQRMNSDEGGDYAINFLPTDLYINGQYRGMYLLTDKVNDDRVAINSSKYAVEDENEIESISWENDPAIAAGIQEYYYSKNSVLEKGGEGGFVIEICGAITEGNCGFITRRGVHLEIKEPDCATQKQVQQIATYFQEFEDALFGNNGCNKYGKYYADYVDLLSLGKMYVLKTFLEDMDLLWASFYMYIDADSTGFTTQLKCCTAWDFDACGAVVNGGSEWLFDTSFGAYNSSGGYKWQLMEYDDFQQIVRKVNSEKIFENNTKSFTDLVNDICSSGNFIDSYYLKVNNAMSMNKLMWTNCTWNNSGETSDAVIKANLQKRLKTWNTFFSDPAKLGGIPPK